MPIGRAETVTVERTIILKPMKGNDKQKYQVTLTDAALYLPFIYLIIIPNVFRFR